MRDMARRTAGASGDGFASSWPSRSKPQERLDRIVREIAENMVAEVCSLYVLRANSVLELYATEGLNPGSVHLAQLKLGKAWSARLRPAPGR